MTMTVLWGGRRGDVQYASRDFWRRHIPIGVARISVLRPFMVDVGALLDMPDGSVARVVGKEGHALGLEVVA